MLEDVIIFQRLGCDAEPVPLLRLMLVKGTPPPTFGARLQSALPQLVRRGERLAADIPGYLERRHALLRQHVPLPPPGLREIVQAYAEPSVDDLWASELVEPLEEDH